MKVEKINEIMKFKQKKWLKQYFDSYTELKSKDEINFQENVCKILNNKFSGMFVEDVRERKRHVTARTDEKCVEIQSKITYDSYKQYETEDGHSIKNFLMNNN